MRQVTKYAFVGDVLMMRGRISAAQGDSPALDEGAVHRRIHS
jgi:hypothetical protein